MNLMAQLPPEEIDRINDHMIHVIAGRRVKQFQPGIPRDRLAGEFIWCVHDVAAQLRQMRLHVRMLTRNPFGRAIQDRDYVEIVVASFEATCFVVHERLLKIYRLLHKNGKSSSQIDTVAASLLKTPDRKFGKQKSEGRKTLFDNLLAERVAHTHKANVERLGVSRIGLLETSVAQFALSKGVTLATARRDKSLKKMMAQASRRALRANQSKIREKADNVDAAADKLLECFTPAITEYLNSIAPNRPD
jgi:hypothetical protein